MEKLQISNSISVSCFDSQDYLQNNKQISDSIDKILGNVSTTYAREYLDNLNGDIFLQDKKVFIFVLYAAKEPVSFVIFSKKSNISVSLDLIWTVDEYKKLGFATMLIRASAVLLKQQNIASVFAKVESQDDVLYKLLESFSKVESLQSENKENQFKFGIKEINTEQILSDIKKFAI